MLSSIAQVSCPRLIDYLVVVSRQYHDPGPNVVQDPHLLKCYPKQNHDDFELPKDVVYFCQPEGCISGQLSAMDMGTTSFVFTLTEKDSGFVRFGISLNFYRKCSDSMNLDIGLQRNNEPTSIENIQKESQAEKIVAEKRTILTSLCLISHQPFFSKFRECLHTLKRIIEAGDEFFTELQRPTGIKWSLWDLFTGKTDQSSIEKPSPILDLFLEIEFWILRLLSTPAPLPGKSCIHLSTLPETLHADPLIFALPDKTRLSLVDFPLHLPLELLGVETCLKVLTAIMLEQKVILQSRDYNALTMSVMAFTTLLYPLQYMFPAIPLLPNTLDGAENLLLSPTPYLIGIPATFLSQKKQFLIPPDVWLVDLDGNRMLGSKNIDPIPSLPPAEGTELIEHLEQALSRMHSTQTSDVPTNGPVTESNTTNGLVGDDVDVVDVATRVAMVQFFNSTNVLANLSEHTRTIRLYPRPVVAFQYYSFLKSRQNLTPFTRRLAQTQAVEFLSEWSLYPENEVFQRIYAGITDPALIGDKAKWFSTSLPQIDFHVWNKTTGALIELVLCWAAQNQAVDRSGNLGCPAGAGSRGTTETQPPLPEFDYAQYRAQCNLDWSAAFRPPQNSTEQLRGAVKPRVSIRRRKKTRPSEMTEPADRDSDQFSGSVPDDRALASQFTFDQSNSVWESSADSSSELSDIDIWDLAENNQSGTGQAVAEVEATDVRNKDSAKNSTRALGLSQESQVDGQSTAAAADRSTEDSVDAVQWNKRTTSMTDSTVPMTDAQDPNRQTKHSESLERNSMAKAKSDASYENTDSEEEIEEASVGKMLLTNLSENLADAASQASSTLSGFLDKQKSMVRKSRGFARKVVTELKQEALSPSIESKSPRSANDQSPKKRTGFFTASKNLFNFAQTAPTQKTSNDQDGAIVPPVHTDPDQSIKDQEFLRLVVNLVKEGREPKYSTGSRLRELLTDENYRSYLISKINVGRMEPVGDPERTLNDCELCTEPVYKSFVWLLQCMLRGLEKTCTNHGIGGLASAMAMLEVCHTHYVELQPEQPTRRNSIQGSVERRSSRHGDENIVDSFTGWWRSTTKDLRPKLPLNASKETVVDKPEDSTLGSRITNQMAGFLSKANRLIGSSESNDTLAHDHTQSEVGSQPSSKGSNVNNDGSDSASTSTNNTSEDSSIQSFVKVKSDDRAIRKSRLAGSYRYVSGKLIPCENTPSSGMNDPQMSSETSTASTEFVCTRSYLYEAFLRPKHRSRLWDHMQFWEDTFFDTVAQERDVLGLDQAPMEMLEKFGNLTPTEKRILQCQEDRLLATCLYNLIACMVMMQVDRGAIRTRVRRIQARCRLGSYFAQALSHLLDQLQHLEGNAIDLLPTMTRCSYMHSFPVYESDTKSEDPKIFEIYKSCVIVRDLTGAIVNRLDYDSSFNVLLSTDEHLVEISLKRKEIDVTERYSSDQAKQIYTTLKSLLESIHIQESRQ